MRVDPSGAFAVPLARRSGRGLWRQPWKIGNIRANLLIAALIGATSTLGLGCAARLVACKVKRGVRNGKMQEKSPGEMGGYGAVWRNIRSNPTPRYGQGARGGQAAERCRLRRAGYKSGNRCCAVQARGIGGWFARELEKSGEQGAKTRQSGGKGSNAGTVFACH